MTYRQFRERVRRLAAALLGLGVKPGDTVAVIDWDSHRYLECFYAVPMIGAVLHTVNVRLSPEQLVYTIDHAEDDMLLINAEFLPLDRAHQGAHRHGQADRPADRRRRRRRRRSRSPASTRRCSPPPRRSTEFPDFDENTRATTFYSTGTTGLPKGV